MNNIRRQREVVGISQADLGRMLDISQQAIAKWENGEASPRADKLLTLAKVLNCSVEELLAGKKEG